MGRAQCVCTSRAGCVGGCGGVPWHGEDRDFSYFFFFCKE